MRSYVIITIILTTLVSLCHQSRILCVMPFPGRSHTLVVDNLCRLLAAKKHHVTAITSFPSQKATPHYYEVQTSNLTAAFGPREDFDIFKMRHTPNFVRFPFFFYMGLQAMDSFLSHPNVKSVIENKDSQFDLVISELFLSEAVYSGLSRRFDCPVVLLSPFQPNLWASYAVGNPVTPSYVPDTFLLFGARMNFWQRLANTLFTHYHELVYKLWYLPKQDEMMRSHFGDHLPPITDIMTNVSLVLVNHHYSLAFPRPYVPNMVEVAGMHVRPVKPLPKDIQKFLDEAKEGAIFFSFGSNVHTSRMPKEQLQVFIDVFNKINMRVLWKWELEEFPNKPKNVMYSDWFPQSDILAHPNLKLFITHGGLASTIESVYRGVPTIGIPIFAEQELNAKHMENAGFGKMVDFDEMSVDVLYNAIMEVVGDPKYREKAKLGSEVLQDRPMRANDTAVFWIEYVLRHKGASHMRSAAQDLSWYQLNCLDVYVTLTCVIVLTTALAVCLLKTLCRLCRSKSVSRDKKEK